MGLHNFIIFFPQLQWLLPSLQNLPCLWPPSSALQVGTWSLGLIKLLFCMVWSLLTTQLQPVPSFCLSFYKLWPHQTFVFSCLLGYGEDLSSSQTDLHLWLFPSGRGTHSQLFQRYTERSEKGVGDREQRKELQMAWQKFFPVLQWHSLGFAYRVFTLRVFYKYCLIYKFFLVIQWRSLGFVYKIGTLRVLQKYYLNK